MMVPKRIARGVMRDVPPRPMRARPQSIEHYIKLIEVHVCVGVPVVGLGFGQRKQENQTRIATGQRAIVWLGRGGHSVPEWLLYGIGSHPKRICLIGRRPYFQQGAITG